MLAHEYGHHIQDLLGTEAQVRRQQERDPGNANALSVKLELQADCYAGVWAKHATEHRPTPRPADLQQHHPAGHRRRRSTAAAAIGDDAIQKKRPPAGEPGQVHPRLVGAAQALVQPGLRQRRPGSPATPSAARSRKGPFHYRAPFGLVRAGAGLLLYVARMTPQCSQTLVGPPGSRHAFETRHRATVISRRSNRFAAALLATAVAVATAVPASAAAARPPFTYQAVDLGFYAHPSLLALNERGQVVGTDAGSRISFIWHAGQGKPLPLPADVQRFSVRDINNAGVVAGGCPTCGEAIRPRSGMTAR